MVLSNLQHLIFGNAVIANAASETADVLAISDAINPDHAKQLVEKIALTPIALGDIQQSQAVAFLEINTADGQQHILTRSHYQNGDQNLPIQQVILLSEDAANTDFDRLLALIKDPIPRYNVTNAPLDPLVITDTTATTSDKKVTIIKSLLDDLVDGDFRLLLGIVAMAIQASVVICNFPADNQQRLALIRGLRLLLPTATRSSLTFTTHSRGLKQALPHIVFSNSSDVTTAQRLDWQQPKIEDHVYEMPYIQLLLNLWDNDVIALVDTIKRLDEIAAHMSLDDVSFADALERIAARHQLDLNATHGNPIESDKIINVLNSDVPMPLALHTSYMILLLENNFQARDAETAKIAAAELDNNPELDASLVPFLNTSIEEQPDAVYSFVRTHLHHIEDDIDPKWLKRLHESAQASVKVAIESGDAATILSWLKLISREPSRYELHDILRAAMIAAQDYVDGSADLAQGLISIAVKRQADMIDPLLADENLVAHLPETLRMALIKHDTDAIDALGIDSRDLFLLSLYRVIQAEKRAVTSSIVRSLWQMHIQQKTDHLPLEFRPSSLINALFEHTECFVNGTLSNLLTLLLSDSTQDELFFRLIPVIAEHEQLTDALAQALEQSNRDTGDIIEILSRLLASDWMNPQAIVDILSTLLVNSNWDELGLALVEQLSRVMAQYPDTNASLGVLWKLAEISATQKNEQMLKVAMRRLLDNMVDMPAETQVVESIQRLRRDSQWSAVGRNNLIKWWRDYARQQGVGQLQKIDKLLDGQRSLEDLRAIVQTSVAMRRIIGNRSLEEFSEAVTITYNLLQALSDGFDTNDKFVDSSTIRQEIDARSEELPIELRPVLSTNLKELAQIVTTLSDNRSKASLIRSDDAIERQLVKGEQEPQSAIDVMRWLSGYLDGVQKDEDEE